MGQCTYRICANASNRRLRRLSSDARGLNFGLSLRLRPNFVYASSEDPGESAHMGQPQSTATSYVGLYVVLCFVGQLVKIWG